MTKNIKELTLGGREHKKCPVASKATEADFVISEFMAPNHYVLNRRTS